MSERESVVRTLGVAAGVGAAGIITGGILWGVASSGLSKARDESAAIVAGIAGLGDEEFGFQLFMPDDEEEIEQRVQALKEQFSGLEVEGVVVRGEDVPCAIVDWAAEHGADMIALSTHGRTGFRRLILGSVAEAVLRHSSVPVLARLP